MITVNELVQKLNLNVLAGTNGLNKQINGCYVGDLLSWVMANAKEKNVWITIIGNINSIAVASLVEMSCIILTENSRLDDDAKNKANELGIPVLCSPLNSYEMAIKISEIIK